MQTFKRSFAPIEAEVENVKGEIVKLSSSLVFTPDVTNRLEAMALDTVGKTGSEMVIEQMVFVFGNKPEFYSQFEVYLLLEVMKYVQETIYGYSKKK